MSRRSAVLVDGLDHGASPFPVAVRKGPFVFSSAISGREPRSGVLDPSLDVQAAVALSNIAEVVRAAGGTTDDIVKVVVFAADRTAARTALDPPWRVMFPDEGSRPVRHTQPSALPPGLHLQLEFVAVLEDQQ